MWERRAKFLLRKKQSRLCILGSDLPHAPKELCKHLQWVVAKVSLTVGHSRKASPTDHAGSQTDCCNEADTASLAQGSEPAG